MIKEERIRNRSTSILYKEIINKKLNQRENQTNCYIPVIPANWEAETEGSGVEVRWAKSGISYFRNNTKTKERLLRNRVLARP
jgi:hypothetical protein